MNDVTYNFEYERKLKACFIGAGGHSFRNVYPTFQYAPVDLSAVCDVNGDRAAVYARQFGALNHYSDHRVMLEAEKPEIVFIVTSYHSDGRVQATDLAMDALQAGAHVWMEKPTAANLQDIETLEELSRKHGRFVMTGLKKIFFPAIEKAKQIIESSDFGRPSSIYIRYPQDLPEFRERGDLNRMRGMLDHIFHPASILHYLMGPIRHFSYEREPFNGGSVTSIRFASGAVGTMHLAAGISGSGPLERVEVVGEGANVAVENGVKVIYHRRAERPAYGRSASYLVKDEEAPLVWEPEFSLGQLYNKNIFYLGYVPEVVYFCECVLNNVPPEKGSLESVKEILKLFEGYRSIPDGQIGIING